MNLEQLIQVGVHWGDLAVVDSHFTEIGISDPSGMIHLKAALVALANVADFEPAIRPTYKIQPEPATIIKPLRKNLAFSKYLRNKVIGHIHPQLVAKAIEWQPILHHAPGHLSDPKFVVLVNIWLLETAINTYVDEDGSHKVFDSETDLMYPPDWKRFVDFLEVTIRGSLAYLQQLNELWAPKHAPADAEAFDLDLAIKAGKTEFKFLVQ